MNTENTPVSVTTFLQYLLRRWIPYTSAMFLAVILSGWYGLSKPPVYEARAVLAVAEYATGGRNSFADVLGRSGIGLASLLAPAPHSDVMKFIELLRSRTVSEKIVEDQELMRALFPGRWDDSNKTWIMPAHTFLGIPKFWAPKPIVPDSGISPWELVDKLRNNVIVTFVKDRNLWEVRNSHSKQGVSEKVLQAIFAETNTILIGRKKDQLRKQVIFLQKKIDDASVMEYRLALVAILAETQKEAMMIEGREVIAMDFLELPKENPTPSRPFLKLYLLLATVLAIFLVALFDNRQHIIERLRGQ